MSNNNTFDFKGALENLKQSEVDQTFKSLLNELKNKLQKALEQKKKEYPDDLRGCFLKMHWDNIGVRFKHSDYPTVLREVNELVNANGGFSEFIFVYTLTKTPVLGEGGLYNSYSIRNRATFNDFNPSMSEKNDKYVYYIIFAYNVHKAF